MQAFQEEDYTKRLDLGLWRKLLRVAKPFYPHLLGVVVLMALSAMIDVALPMMNAFAIDHFIAERTTEGLPLFIAEYIGLAAGQMAVVFGFIYLAGRVETGVCYLIRKLGFRKLQELPFAYYDRMPVGYLMSRLTNDTQRLGDTIGWSLVDLCWGAVFLVACAVQMLALNWQLALVVLLVIPPLAALSWKFQKEILASYRAVRKRNSQITSGFNEGINGAKTTKTLVREQLNIEEFDEVAQGMRTASVRAATLSALFLPIVVSLGSLATGYALWQGGNAVLAERLVAGTGMTIGVLQVFINYTVQFFQPVRDIARIFAELQSSQAAAERVMSLLETEPDIVDTPEVEAAFGDNFHPRRENWPALKGEIEFRDVSFRYKDGEQVLSHFNLHVDAGQTIALVGETGSGKSTIVNLVCRFYEPTQGQVLIDGVDYRERSQLWLESNLGYVLQSAGRPGGGGAPRRPDGRRRALHPRDEGRLRRPGGRGRQPPLHRAEAARLLCPGDPDQPRDLRAGRGDLLRGHGDGAADPDRDPEDPGRADELHHRPPPLHHPLRRPDPRDPRRQDRRGRHPPPAHREAGRVLQAVHEPVPGRAGPGDLRGEIKYPTRKPVRTDGFLLVGRRFMTAARPSRTPCRARPPRGWSR